MMKPMASQHVLLVAFHFPPLFGSSGIQRTLRFAQHLPEFGWEPIILTITSNAYEKTSNDLLQDIPQNIIVKRAIGLDTARHLSIKGRYPKFLANPDRWMSWQLHASFLGGTLIEKYRPQAIWSTYPIATAHCIAANLHKRSGLPWIADFRDPMAQDGYPADPTIWRSFKRIEENAVALADCCTFTTPGSIRAYQSRYPAYADKFELIENGYDQESFNGLRSEGPLNPGKITLLHSGIIYPDERDPTCFFQALRQLLDDGDISSGNFCMRLRGSFHESHLTPLIERFALQGVIELLPPIPYRKALNEMVDCEGLVIFQAANCNDQIPAKLYEYLRTGRPILGLTDPNGDTAWALHQAGISSIAPLDNTSQIADTLSRFLKDIRAGKSQLPDSEVIDKADRRNRTKDLAHLLDRISASTNKK